MSKRGTYTYIPAGDTSVECSRNSASVFGQLFRNEAQSRQLDCERWQANFYAVFDCDDLAKANPVKTASFRVVNGSAKAAKERSCTKSGLVRTSPQKLNLVAQVIRGKKADAALADLTFSKKRIASDVKKCLQEAISNAENQHSLDVNELVVVEAYVGKKMSVKKCLPRGRGRFHAAAKPSSILTVKVEEASPKGIDGAKRA